METTQITFEQIKAYGTWKAVSSYRVLMNGRSIGRVHQTQASRSDVIWTAERGEFRTQGFGTRIAAAQALVAKVSA